MERRAGSGCEIDVSWFIFGRTWAAGRVDVSRESTIVLCADRHRTVISHRRSSQSALGLAIVSLQSGIAVKHVSLGTGQTASLEVSSKAIAVVSDPTCGQAHH